LPAPRIAAKRTPRRTAQIRAEAARHRGPDGRHRPGLTSLPGELLARLRLIVSRASACSQFLATASASLGGNAPGAGATEALELGARPRRTPDTPAGATGIRSPRYATNTPTRPRPSLREATAGGSRSNEGTHSWAHAATQHLKGAADERDARVRVRLAHSLEGEGLREGPSRRVGGLESGAFALKLKVRH
jgi:hypothetical protein